jgi:hypothetical protein
MDLKFLESAAKSQFYHLLFDGGFLSKDSSAHIKKLLSDKQCVLKSLILRDCRYNDDEDEEVDTRRRILWGEIICCLSNNQSVKYVSLDGNYAINSLWREKFSTIEKIVLCGNADIKFPPFNVLGRHMPNLKTLDLGKIGIDVVPLVILAWI